MRDNDGALAGPQAGVSAAEDCDTGRQVAPEEAGSGKDPSDEAPEPLPIHSPEPTHLDSEVSAVDVAERFYREALERLGEHARKGGTAYGAAVVLKHVAVDHGLDVSRVPLPRPTRAERDELGFGRGERGWTR